VLLAIINPAAAASPAHKRPYGKCADAEDLHAHLNNTYEAAFNELGEKDLCPGAGMLEKINAALR
jgi:hypothetical protein